MTGLTVAMTVAALVVMLGGRGGVPGPRRGREGSPVGDGVVDRVLADPASRAELIERLREDLVSTEEAADALGVSPQRVHQLAKREDFPVPVRRGARWSLWELREFAGRWRRDPGRPAGS